MRLWTKIVILILNFLRSRRGRNSPSSQVSPVIFEQGNDPGTGQLRIVANLEKMDRVDDARNISFEEISEVAFSKGRSVLIEEYFETKLVEGQQMEERQFKIVGLTLGGRPLVVVLTPRDKFGQAKRVVTAWQVSRKSKEVRKLLKELPHIARELVKKRE